MVYKFTNLSRREVEAMMGVRLQETRVYQEAKAEGEQSGQASLVLRQLARKVGEISAEARWSNTGLKGQRRSTPYRCLSLSHWEKPYSIFPAQPT